MYGCRVFVPVTQHDGRRDVVTWEPYAIPGDIGGATYAMREAGIVSVPIDDPADETPRRLHVSGRLDVVAYHVDAAHYRGQPDPLQPRDPVASGDDDALPF